MNFSQTDKTSFRINLTKNNIDIIESSPLINKIGKIMARFGYTTILLPTGSLVFWIPAGEVLKRINLKKIMFVIITNKKTMEKKFRLIKLKFGVC